MAFHYHVYMQDIPRNTPGMPLRIKLATHLRLGCLTDSLPALHRHYKANTPGSEAMLTNPIPCFWVSVNVNDIKGALLNITGIEDVVIRVRHDGQPEVFVSM